MNSNLKDFFFMDGVGFSAEKKSGIKGDEVRKYNNRRKKTVYFYNSSTEYRVTNKV